MNSFNHYAYGSVIDWIYEKAAGISHRKNYPGFTSAVINPHPDPRIGFLDAVVQTRNGKIRSTWEYQENEIRYEIEVRMPAPFCILSQNAAEESVKRSKSIR